MSRTAALQQLRTMFRDNGYVRRKNEALAKRAGAREYKKGFELRLVADSSADLARLRKLLHAAGFVPGRPFTKGNQFRQPIYGHEQVSRLLKALTGRGLPPRPPGMKPGPKPGLAASRRRAAARKTGRTKPVRRSPRKK